MSNKYTRIYFCPLELNPGNPGSLPACLYFYHKSRYKNNFQRFYFYSKTFKLIFHSLVRCHFRHLMMNL